MRAKEAFMLKKLTFKQKGTLFLFGTTSFIWFMIGINNNDDGLLYIFIIGFAHRCKTI